MYTDVASSGAIVTSLSTQTLRVVVADEDTAARENIRAALAALGHFQIVAETNGVDATLSTVRGLRPDLLIVDVGLSGGGGFKVVDDLHPEELPTLIFTTDIDRFGTKAFDAGATDYLLKPLRPERLKAALGRVRERFSKLAPYPAAFVEDSQLAQRKKPSRVVVKSGGRLVILSLAEIACIEADSNYVRLNVGDKFYPLRETISSIEKKLDPGQFLRIHRSIIINLDHLLELQPCKHGEFIALLKNGRSVSLGRSYRQKLDVKLEQLRLSAD